MARRAAERARSLRVRALATIAGGALLFVAAVVWIGSAGLARFVEAQADGRLLDAGHRSVALVDRMLAARQREMALIAAHPTIVAAARGVPGAARGAVALARLVNAVGLTVAPRGAGEPAWVGEAAGGGTTGGSALLDSAGTRVVLAIASAVRDPASGQPIGAVRGLFPLTPLEEALGRAGAGSAIQVDVIDATGHVVSTTSGAARLAMMPGYERLAASARDSIFSFDHGAGGTRRATMFFTNGGQWRLLSHADQGALAAPAREARRLLLAGGLALLGVVALALWLVGRYVARRVSDPATELAGIAEAVAAGDLSVEVGRTETDDEIGRLRRATGGMIIELRRLAMTMRTAAQETAAMSTEITASSEEMSASAQEMARTSNELSGQAQDMARLIRDAAADATNLSTISDTLTAGARDGVARNAALRALAHDSRGRLDASIQALESLAAEVQTSATAVEALAIASEEVRAFVTLVHKMARQSKLLALNAAMEAARAGDQGQGFAVVATEVRRLAATSSEAAEKTEALVRDIVGRIEQSRGASAHTVGTVQSVLEATRHGVESFGEIERAVRDAERWAGDAERTATTAGGLVAAITRRLGDLSKGTEQFAAAMEEVAAGSEEQSASTEEIAAAAQALATAADRLARLVATFRLGEELAATEAHRRPTTALPPPRRTAELVGG